MPPWFLAHWQTAERFGAGLVTSDGMDYGCACIVEAILSERAAANARNEAARIRGWGSHSEQVERESAQSWIASIPARRAE